MNDKAVPSSVHELSQRSATMPHAQPVVSPAVVKRLPRYFRYLRDLLREGKMRVSSGELAQRMHITASQIRQDLNCFGGFGQQGYGYNVNYLYTKIGEILGVAKGFHAILIGVGNLGHALVQSSMFEKRGVDIVATFDVDPALFGQTIEEIPIYPMQDLEKFCEDNVVDIAVLTVPRDAAHDVVRRLSRIGIPGVWNFTSAHLYDFADHMKIESVHLGDSLMMLCYALTEQTEPFEKGEDSQSENP